MIALINDALYEITAEEWLLLDLYSNIFEEEYDKDTVKEYNSLIQRIEENNPVDYIVYNSI